MGMSEEQIQAEAIKLMDYEGLNEVTEAIKSMRGVKDLAREEGVSEEDIQAAEDEDLDEADELTDEEERVKAETLSKFEQIQKAVEEGRPIEPVYFPRDKSGKFISRTNSPSPNPLGRPRQLTNIWGKFCQVMQMTAEEVNLLLEWPGLTLADRAAIQLASSVAHKGLWPQQLEVINREEGKVQDKVEVTVPPQPIRFVTSPGRKQIPEDTGEVIDASPDLVSDEATGIEAESG